MGKMPVGKISGRGDKFSGGGEGFRGAQEALSPASLAESRPQGCAFLADGSANLAQNLHPTGRADQEGV